MNEISIYPVALMLGILLSAFFWARMVKSDSRLVLIYGAGLGFAFLGAKVAYVFSEGWLYWGQEDCWKQWLVGKSVTGALLGGYLGVELSKKMVGYVKATGDRFAMVVPMAVALGRVGCFDQGCCGGVMMSGGWVWPSVVVEFGFQLVMMVVLLSMKRAGVLKGQLFHIYLMCYGLFRFAHEYVRLTPKVFLGELLSGYQLIALLIFGFGLIRFWQRQSNRSSLREG